jgi:hypothetical protein
LGRKQASNSITPEDCRIASAPLLAPRRRSGRAKSLPNVAYWHQTDLPNLATNIGFRG